MPAEVIIVGGGISGLATAYYLGRQGIHSVIIEKSHRLGGLVETELINGCRLEAGPDSYIAAKPAVAELAGDLGDLSSAIIPSNDDARRVFIVRQGRLVAMPSGMMMMVPGRWGPVIRSGLLSTQTKLRLLTETLSRPRQRTGDVTVSELIGEHFGQEVVDYIAEPLLCGVYGGRVDQLSAESVLPRFAGYERKYGSLVRGARSESKEISRSGSLFRSFRDGMQQLTDALGLAIGASSQVIQSEVTRVSRISGGWRVQAVGDSLSAKHLILACPAHVCRELLQDSAIELAQELDAISYSSAILTTLVFDRASLGHPLDGFGFLVPQKERRTVAAATWVSTKFPSRVPANFAAIRTFIVGPQAAELMDSSEEALLETARSELRRLMGVETAPRFSTTHKWPNSMPQYLVGHAERVKRIREHTRGREGLHLVGNAYEGVGIPDCVRLAKQVAECFSAYGR